MYTTKQNDVCTHLEVFRKLQEELFIDPQLLKRTSWIPFRMQLLQISFYVIILVKKEPRFMHVCYNRWVTIPSNIYYPALLNSIYKL